MIETINILASGDESEETQVLPHISLLLRTVKKWTKTKRFNSL